MKEPSERRTQKTRPKGIDPETGKPYEAVEIPVPRRELFDRLIGKAIRKPPKQP